MRYFFYLILLIEAISILSVIVKYNLYLNKKDKGKNNSVTEYEDINYHLNIIIPVLREQMIIENTLNHFESIINKENTTIYVVTTEKEEFEKKLSILNTSSLANDILDNMSIDQIISKYNKLLPN